MLGLEHKTIKYFPQPEWIRHYHGTQELNSLSEVNNYPIEDLDKFYKQFTLKQIRELTELAKQYLGEFESVKHSFHSRANRVYPVLREPSFFSVKSSESVIRSVFELFKSFSDCFSRIEVDDISNKSHSSYGCVLLKSRQIQIKTGLSPTLKNQWGFAHELGHACYYLRNSVLNDYCFDEIDSESWAYSFEKHWADKILSSGDLFAFKEFYKARKCLDAAYFIWELKRINHTAAEAVEIPIHQMERFMRFRETLFTCPGYQMVNLFAHKRADELDITELSRMLAAGF